MSELTSELNFLAHTMRLYINDFNDLTLSLPNKTHDNVTVERAFPLNAPNQFIIVKDQNGDEIGIIEDSKHLDNDSFEVLEEALRQAYFMPQIIKINDVETNFHIPTWFVETDKGPRTFEIPSSRRDVRVVGNGRVLLRDADGNRYEIADYRQLDADSQAIVETLI